MGTVSRNGHSHKTPYTNLPYQSCCELKPVSGKGRTFQGTSYAPGALGVNTDSR